MHMHSLFILLALLSAVQGFNLTYPIKGVYFGYASINWADPGSIFNTAAAQGYNLAIMSFYADQAYEMVQAWDGMSQNKQSYLDAAHNNGMAVLISVWIQQQYGDLISSPNATALGMQMASQVTQRNLDGINVLIRETGANYTIGSLSSSASIQWVVDLAISLRNSLGPNAIITFSPYASDFGPIGGTFVGGPGPLGGFTAIHPQIANLINHYSIFYFAIGTFCYVDYNSLFVTSPSTCPPASTIVEISANINIDKSKLVITKSIQTGVSGYMNTSALHDAIVDADQNLGWHGGVVGWTWTATDNGTSAEWVSQIYPPSNSSNPSTSSASSTSSSTSSTSASSSSSSTSATTASSTSASTSAASTTTPGSTSTSTSANPATSSTTGSAQGSSGSRANLSVLLYCAILGIYLF